MKCLISSHLSAVQMMFLTSTFLASATVRFGGSTVFLPALSSRKLTKRSESTSTTTTMKPNPSRVQVLPGGFQLFAHNAEPIKDIEDDYDYYEENPDTSEKGIGASLFGHEEYYGETEEMEVENKPTPTRPVSSESVKMHDHLGSDKIHNFFLALLNSVDEGKVPVLSIEKVSEEEYFNKQGHGGSNAKLLADPGFQSDISDVDHANSSLDSPSISAYMTGQGKITYHLKAADTQNHESYDTPSRFPASNYMTINSKSIKKFGHRAGHLVKESMEEKSQHNHNSGLNHANTTSKPIQHIHFHRTLSLVRNISTTVTPFEHVNRTVLGGSTTTLNVVQTNSSSTSIEHIQNHLLSSPKSTINTPTKPHLSDAHMAFHDSHEFQKPSELSHNITLSKFNESNGSEEQLSTLQAEIMSTLESLITHSVQDSTSTPATQSLNRTLDTQSTVTLNRSKQETMIPVSLRKKPQETSLQQNQTVMPWNWHQQHQQLASVPSASNSHNTPSQKIQIATTTVTPFKTILIKETAINTESLASPLSMAESSTSTTKTALSTTGTRTTTTTITITTPKTKTTLMTTASQTTTSTTSIPTSTTQNFSEEDLTTAYDTKAAFSGWTIFVTNAENTTAREENTTNEVSSIIEQLTALPKTNTSLSILESFLPFHNGVIKTVNATWISPNNSANNNILTSEKSRTSIDVENEVEELQQTLLVSQNTFTERSSTELTEKMLDELTQTLDDDITNFISVQNNEHTTASLPDGDSEGNWNKFNPEDTILLNHDGSWRQAMKGATGDDGSLTTGDVTQTVQTITQQQQER